MRRVDIKEAGKQLVQLIEEAASGEEIVITRGDGSSFRIVPLSEISPRPEFGSAKGMVELSEDFDEPLEDFELYAP